MGRHRSGLPAEPLAELRPEADDVEIRLLGHRRSMRSREVAAKASVSITSARKFWHALGFPHVEDHLTVFTEADLLALQALAGLVRDGVFDETTALGMTRAFARTTDRLAVWQVQLMAEVIGEQLAEVATKDAATDTSPDSRAEGTARDAGIPGDPPGILGGPDDRSRAAADPGIPGKTDDRSRAAADPGILGDSGDQSWAADEEELGGPEPDPELDLTRAMPDPATARAAAVKLAELADDLEPLLIYAWRRHLAAAISRMVTDAEPVEDKPGVIRSVGFADLVSFTRLVRRLSERELAQMVQRFEALASDVVTAHGGRVIKTVGDEILFVAIGAAPAAAIALDLVASMSEDDVLPDVRVGMANGRVISRLGDVFGTTVNRASRLTAIARPRTVLVDDSIAAALASTSGFEMSGLRSRTLRGIGPVTPWVLRRAQPSRGGDTVAGPPFEDRRIAGDGERRGGLNHD